MGQTDPFDEPYWHQRYVDALDWHADPDPDRERWCEENPDRCKAEHDHWPWTGV